MTEEEKKQYITYHIPDASGGVRVNMSGRCLGDEEGTWVTINGAHILIKDGETAGQAFKRTTGNDLSGKGGSAKSAKISEMKKGESVFDAETYRAKAQDSSHFAAYDAEGNRVGQGEGSDFVTPTEDELTVWDAQAKGHAETQRAKVATTPKPVSSSSQHGTLSGDTPIIVKNEKSKSTGSFGNTWKYTTSEATEVGEGHISFGKPSESSTDQVNRNTVVATHTIKAGLYNEPGSRSIKSHNINWDKVNRVSGDTFDIKEELKSRGFRFEGSTKNWVK